MSSPSDDCPERPQSEDDLDFVAQSMVHWFNPIEGVRTGTKSVLSSLFGAYADWREVQALQAAHALPPGNGTKAGTVRTRIAGETSEWYDLSDAESLWMDYTADLGDGFNATHTVARLLAEQHLTIDGCDTERGRLLVMGGDQVYPTATRTEYRNRLVGPYQAALPCVVDGTPPLLFAVPGNHDWYDGLTSFLRLFTQGRWIGGWKTQQRRSYFALKLPHDWWLWGLDVQLASDVDEPQLNYFRSIAEDETIMPSGSRIILCTPEPSWLYAETKGEDAYHNLGYFKDELIIPNEHEMAVGLAGDLHMYARYAAAETDQQRLIAGGGGAYLYPTHDLPDTLDVETPDGHERRFTMQKGRDSGAGDSVFPSRSRSFWLSLKALLLPLKNWRFGVFVAVLYLLFAWFAQSATVVPLFEISPDAASPAGRSSSLLEYMANTGAFGAVLGSVEVIIKHSPGAMLLVVVLWLGLGVFADLEGTIPRAFLGAVHAVAHLLLAVVLMWCFAAFNVNVLNWDVSHFGHVLLFAGEMVVFGGALGGMLVGLYLLLTNWLFRLFGYKGVHANELFSCQHSPHYKNFVRFFVGEDGKLTIYPLGVSTVETNWSLRSGGAPEEPWFEAESNLADRIELIEGPVTISRSGGEESSPKETEAASE